MSAPGGKLNRIVVAPHADDESLGCGGLLAKYPDTLVVTCAKMGSARRDEFDRAMDRLGIYITVEFDMEDGMLGADPRGLTTRMDRLLMDHKPEELYLPAPGTHQDHVAVYQAGLRSARLSMNTRHHCPPNVLVYDVPAYGLDLAPTGLQYSLYELLDVTHVRRKAEAIACYDSQMPGDDHPAATETVFAAAKQAGGDVGKVFAEKYAPVRMVRP